MRDLEGKTCEDGLRFVWPGAEQAEGRPHGGLQLPPEGRPHGGLQLPPEGRPHGGLQLPHEGSGGAGAELCSLGTATGPEGTTWSWDRGGSGWGLGKGSSSRGLVRHWDRLPRAVVMTLSLLEFKFST